MNISNTKNRALSLSTLLAVGVLLVSISSSASEYQEIGDSPSRFAMAVHTEDVFAEELIAGQYTRAIAAYGATNDRRAASFSVNNRLCIAYVLAKDVANSKTYCDAAVVSSRKGLVRHKNSFETEHRKNVAIALTNRGVILAMSGEIEDAERDFKAAMRMFRWMKEPAFNLEYLRTKTADEVASL